MESTLVGTVRGKLIELTAETGLPAGSKVRVKIEHVGDRVVLSADRDHAEPKPGVKMIRTDARNAVLETAGAWADADQAEFDEWLQYTQEMRQAHHRDTFAPGESQ